MASQLPRKCMCCGETRRLAAFSMLYQDGRRLRMSLVCIRCMGPDDLSVRESFQPQLSARL